MKRSQLEHLLRAAATIADVSDILVIGSQAILGSYPDAPATMLRSVEADLVPLDAPELADLIDGTIGEGSPFHSTFGYYAQGVGLETAVLSPGWRDRLVPIRNDATRGATGWCLDPHDLVLAKLFAGLLSAFGAAEASAFGDSLFAPSDFSLDDDAGSDAALSAFAPSS
jgi:hypothetical protein